ncbi:MAG TPA: BCAM0308 family protein [Burkholderiaceae bacterium]
MPEPTSRSARPAPAAHRVGFERPDSHDPYRARGKLREPVACPDCGAVQEAGRWRWREALPGAVKVRCPACRRVHDGLPAGEIRLSGDFLADHRDEVMARVTHVADRARKRYPLQRIMQVDQDGADVRITVTSPHLARSLGLALHESFKGELELDTHAQGGPRVRWSR